MWIVAIAIGACSVYDGSRLGAGTHSQRPDGAGDGASADAGHAGGAGGRAGDGGGASGSGSGSGSVRCGDGLVNEGETCDTGLPDGTPGACPSVCSAPACSAARLTGTACTTECSVLELPCKDGDGCCPPSCSSEDDDDCSGMCGDGIVQSELAETCEDEIEATACPAATDCDDDDPCTRDSLSGSSSNCNAACVHTPITTVESGDGCCPTGADAITDSDCSPRCGNGVREGAEECDRSTGCDESCKLTISDEQRSCLESGAESECDRCQCLRCTEAITACTASGDASSDQACAAINRCAIEANCAGDACYCGTASYSACAFEADGPCKELIESAAGTTSPLRIQALGDDPTSVLGRALTLGECRRAQCATECQ